MQRLKVNKEMLWEDRLLFRIAIGSLILRVFEPYSLHTVSTSDVKCLLRIGNVRTLRKVIFSET